jgi:hypothetical protein
MEFELGGFSFVGRRFGAAEQGIHPENPLPVKDTGG